MGAAIQQEASEPIHVSRALALGGLQIQSDKEVVLAAVRRYGWVLRYAAPALQADREGVETAVSSGGNAALRCAVAPLRGDAALQRAAAETERRRPHAVPLMLPERSERP